MTITSKGQVTIPKELRDSYHLDAYTDVEFVAEGGRVYIRPVDEPREKSRFSRFRGSADTNMSTEEILALTRSE